jgi:hypothetical protein
MQRNRVDHAVAASLIWSVLQNRTPFRRGTEVLVRLEREDNKRRRRVSEGQMVHVIALYGCVIIAISA